MPPAKNSVVDWEAPKDLSINSLDKQITKISMNSASTKYHSSTIRIFAYSTDLSGAKMFGPGI